MCGLFAAVVILTASEPKFDRDDWRGAAQGAGRAAVSRAIVVSPGRGPQSFGYYRPQARVLDEPQARVRELTFVALPSAVQGIGRKPEAPPADPVAAPPPGFELVEQTRREPFTIVRFRASRPRVVSVNALIGAIPGEPVTIFLEPAGARVRN